MQGTTGLNDPTDERCGFVLMLLLLLLVVVVVVAIGESVVLGEWGFTASANADRAANS
jgi:hypothetical protein